MTTAVFTQAGRAGRAREGGARQVLRSIASLRHEPSFKLVVALAVITVGASAAFAHLAEDYLTGDPIVRWDVHFAAWLHAHAAAPVLDAFKIVTYGGNVAVLAVLVICAVVFLLRRAAVKDAVLVSVVALGVEVVNALLKLAFHRPRPELAYVHLDTYSFPSGHAAGAAAIYGVLAVLVARHRAPKTWVVYGTLWMLAVATIGFSRLYLEAHYLSDVLAGLALGLVWLSACLLVYMWVEEHRIVRVLPGRLRRLLVKLERQPS